MSWNWTTNKGGSGSAALMPHPSRATGPDTELGQAADASVKFVFEHYRWLLLILPIYAILAHGLAAAPLAAVLAIAVIAYNGILRLASGRSESWVTSRALYLRCVEIGLICIGFSLLYVKEGSFDDHRFYYDGFYAIFVALAALTAGRKGVFWSATVATLAVGIGQIMLTPSSPAFFSWDGIAYWISVALSVGTFGLYFIAIGLLAYLYTDFQRTA